MTSHEPHALGYEPQQRPRGKWPVQFLLAALILVLGFALWATLPSIWRQAQAAYWQRQCMRYSAPADQVVFDSNPAAPIMRPNAFWTKLGSYVGYGVVSPADAVAFLHERSAARKSNYPLLMLGLRGRRSGVLAFEYWRGSTTTRHSCSGYWTLPDLRGKRLRLFAGQPDPANGAHFTIPYEADGQPGTIDGWVTEDGPVELQFRSGSASRQDPSFTPSK